jgi:hypothetical protein
MPQSQALRDFDRTLGMARALASREARFQDPPTPRHLNIVRAMRGGAVVLMVAAFENFLHELVDERLYELTLHPLRFKHANIPDEMMYHNISQTLERALKGPFGPGQGSKAYKSTLMTSAAQSVVLGAINTLAFSETTRSNPSARRVTELFKSLGISDIYARMKNDFDRRWGMPTARTFISDKLDQIVNRRHEVAHTASVLNVSRADLTEALRFLKVFATSCDRELERHVKFLLR